jgi:O-methyltransferase
MTSDQLQTLRVAFANALAESGFERDEDFDELYVQGLLKTNTRPTPLRRRDRFRRLLKELEHTLHLRGDVAECGCFRGLSSFLICSRLKQHDAFFNGAGYEIYDSFQGLSEPQLQDLAGTSDAAVSASLKAGFFNATLAEVERALSAFPRISYFPGWIPRGFPPGERTYRFVHVDVDLYQPTRDSLGYFWPRMVSGGVIVCDDYNWPGARRAVDELAATHGVTPTITPNTQAIFTKT